MSEEIYSGSCLCGGITYTIQKPFIFFQNCHCSRCRKSTGAGHGSSLFLKKDLFAWTGGEELMRRFEMPETEHFCTGFCSVCGSSMPWLSRNGKYMLVPAGTLDDDPGARPTRNIYWGSRAPWYSSVDALAKHDEGP